MADDQRALPMAVIYARPRDMPNVPFVVRRWKLLDGTLHAEANHVECATIEDAQRVVQELVPGSVLIDANDPCPAIVEVWM